LSRLKLVGKAQLTRLRKNRMATNAPWFSLARGIQENHPIRQGDVFGQLRGKLVNADYLCTVRQLPAKHFAGLPGNAVIGAKPVAVGDH